jgi:hypothetical protein
VKWNEDKYLGGYWNLMSYDMYKQKMTAWIYCNTFFLFLSKSFDRFFAKSMQTPSSMEQHFLSGEQTLNWMIRRETY